MANSYLIHYNHNHDRLGRFARSAGGVASSVGGKFTKSNKKQAPQADIKKGKSANTKLSEKERNRIVNSGSAKEVSKYKDRLSNRDLETAINRLQNEKVQRIDLEKRLSELDSDNKRKNKETALEKIEKYSDDLGRISDSVEKAAKMYNTAAKVHNLMSSPNDQWPIYGEKKKAEEKHKTSDYVKKLIDTGSRADIYNNRSKMTTKEYNEATKRRENDDKNREAIRKEKEAQAAANQKAVDDYNARVRERAERSKNRIIEDNEYRKKVADSEYERRVAESRLADLNEKEYEERLKKKRG